jgi:hypothetical protein
MRVLLFANNRDCDNRGDVLEAAKVPELSHVPLDVPRRADSEPFGSSKPGGNAKAITKRVPKHLVRFPQKRGLQPDEYEPPWRNLHFRHRSR